MKAVKLMFNGVNQLALGTISATSDLLLKLPGVVLSEASNVINAGVGVASEFSEQRLVDKSVCVNSFGEHLRKEHRDDAKRAKYLDGSIPLEDMFGHIGKPKWIRDLLAKQPSVAQPITVVVEDDPNEPTHHEQA